MGGYGGRQRPQRAVRDGKSVPLIDRLRNRTRFVLIQHGTISEVSMHKFMLPIFALAGTFLLAATTMANATDRDEAAKLCRANPNCILMSTGGDGDIYCVRQSDGHCIVIVCPDILDCYVYRRTRPGGNITISGTTAGRLFHKRPTHKMKVGVQRVMTPQGEK